MLPIEFVGQTARLDLAIGRKQPHDVLPAGFEGDVADHQLRGSCLGGGLAVT